MCALLCRVDMSRVDIVSLAAFVLGILDTFPAETEDPGLSLAGHAPDARVDVMCGEALSTDVVCTLSCEGAAIDALRGVERKRGWDLIYKAREGD